MRPHRLTHAARSVVFVVVGGVLAGCSGARYGDRESGPPGDVAAIRTQERGRWERGVTMARGEHLPVGVAVDGDAALAAAAPGEGGWVTTVYRRRRERWIPIASRPAAPAHCLFERAGIDALRERGLTAQLLAVAPVNGAYPDDRVMHIDSVNARFSCHAPS